MTKWDYIRMISKCGTHYGNDGGVLDLLEWCKKPNTNQVTMEEAKAFWERRGQKSNEKA